MRTLLKNLETGLEVAILGKNIGFTKNSRFPIQMATSILLEPGTDIWQTLLERTSRRDLASSSLRADWAGSPLSYSSLSGRRECMRQRA